MMPRTHAIIGALIAALLSFKFSITFADVIIGAIFGSVVDLDHVYAHWKSSGILSLSETARVGVLELENGKTPYIHGYYGLLTMAVPASAAYYFFGLKYGLLIYLPFLAHLFFDFIVKPSKSIRALYKFGNWLIPITLDELILDAFVFNFLMLSLLYFGILV